MKDANIFDNFCAIQIRDEFLISGGFHPINIEYSKKTIKISLEDLKEIKIDKKADMILAKALHKLVMVDIKTIYSLGGKADGKKYIKKCERYNVDENKWEPAPDLTEGKFSISATSLKETFIFVFCGNKGAISNVIESLNTKEKREKWKVFKLLNTGSWALRSEIGCYHWGDNQILLFGGIQKHSGCTDEVHIFDVEKKTITEQTQKMQKKEWFLRVSPISLLDGSICIIGHFAKDIHSGRSFL